jgi:hypothetical protein
MTNQLIKLDAPELSVIEGSKAEQIRATFAPMADMLSKFEEAFNSVVESAKQEIDKPLTKRAKELRIRIAKVRIETEKVRKAQKEEYLRAGKAIDGVSNVLKWAVSDKEAKLQEIEKHFEIQEQKRLEALQEERARELSKYVEDSHERKLSDMDEEVWAAYLNTKKQEHQDRIKAEQEAEKERIRKEEEARKEQERIRKENELLKKQIEERQKKEAEERAKREAIEAKERAEREAREKAEREAYEAKIRQEKEEKARITAQLKAKEEAERKAKEEAEAKEQAELAKGDDDKIKDLLEDLRAIYTKYVFKAKKNADKFETVKSKLQEAATIFKGE